MSAAGLSDENVVYVIVNGSDLGERVLRIVWEAAQRLLREYGMEVYVIPYFNPRHPVTLVYRGVEYKVRKAVSVKEVINLILDTAIASASSDRDGGIVFGAVTHDDPDYSSAVIVSSYAVA